MTEHTNIPSRIMALRLVAFESGWSKYSHPPANSAGRTFVMKGEEKPNNSTLTEKGKKLSRKSVIHLYKSRCVR